MLQYNEFVYSHSHSCACPACSGAISESTGSEDYSGASTNKPFYNWQQAADQITRWDAKWGGGNFGTAGSLTYAFDGAFSGEFFPVTASARTIAYEAFRMIAEVANITFNEVAYDPNFVAEDVLFKQYGTSAFGGGYAGWSGGSNPNDPTVTITSGEVNVGGERLQLFLHEIGHAIGLAHPGEYDGLGPTYGNDAVFWNDTGQYTVMSYWDASITGANYNELDVTNLMLYDIAALQKLYGANMTTRAGDTVYGFNSTALKSTDGSIDDSWRLSNASDDIVGAVWDAGGIDRLDLSGFSSNSDIDLRQEAFSSFGGLVNNFSIARNVVIENATGGSGDDTIKGNASSNALNGGEGNDRIDGLFGADVIFGGGGNDMLIGGQGGDYYHGGTGFDILNYSGSAQAVNVSFYLNAGYGARDSRGDRFADDTLEGLRGSSKGDILVGDDGRGEMFFGGGGADAIRGNGGNDIIYGEGGNDLLFDGFGADTYYGGSGFDTMMFVNALSGVFVNLLAGRGYIGETAGDTYSSVEGLVGSRFGDVLFGDNATNTIDGRIGGDAIDGKGGRDTLTGGGGNDKFIFGIGSGVDLITDFDKSGNDVIDIKAFGFGNFSQVTSRMTDLGSDVLVNLGGGDQIRIADVEIASLTATDFILV
ncbi:MAG: M10 family metallopeptidase C-terminal domain-containing protein [Ahrensia sp.]